MTESHIIKIILDDNQGPNRWLRYILPALALLVGLLGLRAAILSLRTPFVYQKDFVQEYLMVQAVVHNLEPYSPLSQLAQEFMDTFQGPIFPHPTPHPPPVILISLPFVFFSYEAAAAIWLLCELLFLTISAHLFLLWLNRPANNRLLFYLTLALVGWPVVTDGLMAGQLMSLLLLLLLAIWLSLRVDNWQAGSVLLGVALALKLLLWPLLLLWVMHRRWRALAIVACVFVGLNLLAALFMGLEMVFHYFAVVGGEVTAVYRGHADNFAIWGLGWRIFEGTNAPMVGDILRLGGIQAPPLLSIPDLAPYASLLLWLLFLLWLTFLGVKIKKMEGVFAILVCAAVIVNPVAWSHYFVLLALPIAVAGRYLYDLDFPRRPTNWGIVLFLLLLAPSSAFSAATEFFIIPDMIQEAAPTVPFAASLLTLTPLVLTIALLHYIWRLDLQRALAISGVEKTTAQ